MADERGIITFVYRGGDRDTVPLYATHITIHETVKVIKAEAFYQHPNIIEVSCHIGVIKICAWAFGDCPRLKRVIMLGVEDVGRGAFDRCIALTNVECNKLEKIGQRAFHGCRSLISIDLPSAKSVEDYAFNACKDLKNARFGKYLRRIELWAFSGCLSLERIALPLKNGLIPHDNTFKDCENLNSVDLVEIEALNETIDALLLEEWKIDMRTEINSINQILPNTYAGGYNAEEVTYDDGEKALRIWQWMSNLLLKIFEYKGSHRRIVEGAAEILQVALPHDTVTTNILPFLDLPSDSNSNDG